MDKMVFWQTNIIYQVLLLLDGNIHEENISLICIICGDASLTDVMQILKLYGQRGQKGVMTIYKKKVCTWHARSINESHQKENFAKIIQRAFCGFNFVTLPLKWIVTHYLTLCNWHYSSKFDENESVLLHGLGLELNSSLGWLWILSSTCSPNIFLNFDDFSSNFGGPQPLEADPDKPHLI